MSTINAHELNPRLILEKYEKYDIGQIPYAIVNQDGEARAIPAQVFDALEKNTQNQTDNDVRQAVLKMVKDNQTDQIDRLNDAICTFLLTTEENEETPWNEKITWLFAEHKLNFLRYLLDLPKETARELLKTLLNQTTELPNRRTFIELVGVKPEEINPLYDVLFKQFGSVN